MSQIKAFCALTTIPGGLVADVADTVTLNSANTGGYLMEHQSPLL